MRVVSAPGASLPSNQVGIEQHDENFGADAMTPFPACRSESLWL